MNKLLKKINKLKDLTSQFGNLFFLPRQLFTLIVASWIAIFTYFIKSGRRLVRLFSIQKYRLVLYVTFTLTLLLLPGQNKYQILKINPQETTINHLNLILPTPAPYPVNVGIPFPFELTATSVLVIDISSGVTIYEKNADLPLPPASTTKIMTALVALDHFPLDKIVEVGKVTRQGRIMHLVEGERISVEALLYGILVHSANDAAEALANSFPEGREGFISAMNKKAKELNLNSSFFTNSSGFYDENHLTSARDLARLSMVALNNPIFAKMVSTRSITVSDVDFTRFHNLSNINELLGKVAGVGGLKTGYLEESGENLVTFMVNPKGKFLTVVLGSEDRFGETEKFISWVLQNFSWQSFVRENSLPSLD